MSNIFATTIFAVIAGTAVIAFCIWLSGKLINAIDWVTRNEKRKD